MDGHFRRKGFPTNRIHEIHGATDNWLREEIGDDSGSRTTKENLPLVLDVSFRFPVDDNLELQPDSMNEILCGKDKTIEPMPCYRPKVLMFDDGLEVHDAMGLTKSSYDYQAWEESMECKMESSHDLKLVVLEIGCGTKVPSVRRECEDVIGDTEKRAAGDVPNPSRFVHIRINPDEYAIDNKNTQAMTTSIAIQGSGLDTLRAIDVHYQNFIQQD